MIKALLLGTIAVSSIAHAEQGDVWVDVNGLSKHYGGRDYFCDDGVCKKKNEVNPGVGVGYEVRDWAELKLGFYKNTYYATTTYAGVNFKKDFNVGPTIVSPGVMFGVVTGYERVSDNVVNLAGSLNLSTTYERVRVTVGYTPLKQVIGKGNDVITLNVGFKF